MATSAVGSTTNTNSNAFTQAVMGNQNLGKEDFLKLLIYQMQNQDPLSPMKNEDFIAQLAQFSSLEQMQNLNKNVQGMNDSMNALGTLQILSQTSSMIGKTVQASDADGSTITGQVTSVNFQNGKAELELNVNGTSKYVTIDKILTVR